MRLEETLKKIPFNAMRYDLVEPDLNTWNESP